MQRLFRALLAGALLTGVIGVSPAAAASGSTCASFRGNATVTPGLPKTGSTDRVRSTISIKRAKLSGCHGTVKSATVSATLRFDHALNCTMLITEITSAVTTRARGTLTLAWNDKHTSTVSFSVLFGSIPNEPSVAKLTGTVTAGMFKGMKETGSVYWSLNSNDCFGGSPLTAFTFSEYSPFVTK